MKKIEKLFLFAFLLMGIMIFVFMNIPPRQSDVITTESSVALFPKTEAIQKAIVQSFKNGKAAYLKPYLAAETTLSIEEIESEYTEEQTAVTLNQFFEDNPPKSFIIQHEGNNKTKTEKFWIGEYESIEKINFSVYIYSEKGIIYSIEITKEAITS